MEKKSRRPLALLTAVVLLLAARVQAQPPGHGGGTVIMPGPVGEVMRSINTKAINEDVPFTLDPICGVVIIVRSATMPYSFYNAGRNPWGQPAIVPFVDSQGPGWILTFGGSSGPCFPRSSSIFHDPTTGRFLGLHFGFNTDSPLAQFLGSPCWLIGANQVTVPCSGITGYYVHHHLLHILNGAAEAFAVQNTAVAFSATAIPTDGLNRIDLPDLEWQSLALESNTLRAAEGDQPGTLVLEIPAELQKLTGFAVFSYDVVDPLSSEVLSSMTLEVAIPK